MYSDYKPTPQQLVEALKLLGYETEYGEEGPSAEDYPELCGELLAFAEITHCNVVGKDHGELLQAYRDVFLEHDTSYYEDDDMLKWQDYQTALRETADRLQHLHAVIPETEHDPIDHPIGDAAHAAGWLGGRLANIRLGLSMTLRDDELDIGLPRQISEMISEAARVIAVLSSVLNPNIQHHHGHEDEDLCDLHRQEVNETLVGIEAATSGEEITEAVVEQAADEAEAGYDVDKLKPRGEDG